MDIDKQYFQNVNSMDYNAYNYYLPRSQTQNIMNGISQEQNPKNLEPQDNIKKSKQRYLQEMENKLKGKMDKNNENLIKSNEEEIDVNKGSIEKGYSNSNYNDNIDVKSLTAVKSNRTNLIFQRNLEDKNNYLNIQNNISANDLMNSVNFKNQSTDYLGNILGTNFSINLQSMNNSSSQSNHFQIAKQGQNNYDPQREVNINNDENYVNKKNITIMFYLIILTNIKE